VFEHALSPRRQVIDVDGRSSSATITSSSSSSSAAAAAASAAYGELGNMVGMRIVNLCRVPR
jgi:hypothetical protein